MPVAYSYIRFSAERQKFGDSVRRQVEKAEAWAKAHNLTVDTTSYREIKGVSAFKGKNRTDGHYLKAFIDAVEHRLVPRGSYLLVESLDRLSRAAVDDALELFLHINRIGITIVDVTTSQVFSREQPKNDRVIALMTMIMVAVRANEESATKSDRLSLAWANKRAEAKKSGKLITKKAPSWLTASPDGTRWLVDERKAAVVREIFELSANGYGGPAIARMFNEQKRPTLTGNPKGWGLTTINSLLHDRAVIGTYTPWKKKGYEQIKEYFPPIVSEALFAGVQSAMAKRRWIGGRGAERVANLFAGYSYCYACGDRMRVVSTSNKKNVYLRCTSAYKATGCTEKMFPYLGAERAILRHLADELSEVMANAQEEADNPLARLQDEKADLQGQLENLIDLYQKSKSDAVAKRVGKVEAEIERVQSQIAATVSPTITREAMQEAAELFELLKGNSGPIDLETRLRVKAALRQVIDRVQFWCDTEYSNRMGRTATRDALITTTRGARPTVAFDYVAELGGETVYLDVAKYLDKVGTHPRQRRKPTPGPV